MYKDNNIRWIHISDLHIGNPDSKWLDNTLRTRLKNLLYDKKIDFVIITGDIIHQGQYDNNDLCRYAESLISDIREICPHLVFCIGNHDYSRNDVRFMILKEWQKLSTEEKRKNERDYGSKLSTDFNKYVSFCKSLDTTNNPITINSYIYDKVPGINIVVLNTSVFAGQPILENGNIVKEHVRVNDEGKLWMQETDFPDVSNLDNDVPTIVIGHHTIQMFEKDSQLRMMEFIENLPAKYYFCGHVHKDWVTCFGKFEQLSSAGLFKDNYNVPAITFYRIKKNANEHIELKRFMFMEGEWSEFAEQRISLLEKNILENQEVRNEKNSILISKLPQINAIFEGRENLLERIQDIFESGKKVVFLEGMGGIGKSELAKQYAIQNKAQFDTILFVSYQGSMRTLLCDDNAFVIENFLPRQIDESEEKFFKRKLNTLHKIGNDRTLIIIDNFDVSEDEHLNLFLEGNYRVIITTRNAHPDYVTVKVGAMRDEDVLFKIFEKNYDSCVAEADRECIKEILELVEYHTYTIELVAKQMKASFMSASEILHVLKEKGFTFMPTESVLGRFEQKSVFRHLCTLFNTSKLNEEEKRVMRYLSLMGIKGIPAARFKEWADLPNFEVINSLIQKSWIRREENQRISLHPLIIEVVHFMLVPDMENCKEYMKHICVYFYTAWQRSYVENMEVVDNLNAIWDYFRVPDAKYIQIWMPLGPVYWQMGFFEEAISKTKLLYDICIKNFGQKSLASGYAAMSLAGCYYNSGMEQESILWYKRSLQHMLDAGLTEGEDLGMAYEKVARCFSWKYEQDFEKAERFFERSMNIRKKILYGYEEGYVSKTFLDIEEKSIKIAKCRIGEVYMEMGRMYQCKGDYRKALICTEAYKQISYEYSKSENAIAYALYDIGVSCYFIGREYEGKEEKEYANIYWNKAIENLQSAIKINMRMRGTLAIDTLNTQEMLGDVYMSMKQFNKAFEAYDATLNMAYNLFDSSNVRIDIIKEKMQVLEASCII